MGAGLNVYTPGARSVACGPLERVENLIAERVSLLAFDKKGGDVPDLVQQDDVRA